MSTNVRHGCVIHHLSGGGRGKNDPSFVFKRLKEEYKMFYNMIPEEIMMMKQKRSEKKKKNGGGGFVLLQWHTQAC